MRKGKRLMGIWLAGCLAASLLPACGSPAAGTDAGSSASGERAITEAAASEATAAESKAAESIPTEDTETAAAEASKAGSVPEENTAQKTKDYGKIQIPGKDGALCGAPIYIAYENGYFAEEGFDVELISADSETRKIGLNNGSIPIVNGDFQFFPSMEEGVKTKVVDKLHDGCIKLVVTPDSDIHSAEDLKGKVIGVDEIGGTPHQVASVWLENAGISARQEDREVSFLPYSDGNLELEALYSGQIDVAAMWDPLGSVAEKAGKVRVILDISKDEPFAQRACCFLYASTKLIDEEPDKVAALLRAYRKAQDWIHKHPEEAVDIIVDKKYSQIEDKDLAAELITTYNYPSYEQRESGEFDIRDDVHYFADQLYQIGYLRTEADAYTDEYYAEIDVDNGTVIESKRGTESEGNGTTATKTSAAQDIRANTGDPVYNSGLSLSHHH